MLRNAEDRKILATLDRESRLALAFSACIMLALDRKSCVQEVVSDACKVFSEVFPEKAGKDAKRSG